MPKFDSKRPITVKWVSIHSIKKKTQVSTGEGNMFSCIATSAVCLGYYMMVAVTACVNQKKVTSLNQKILRSGHVVSPQYLYTCYYLLRLKLFMKRYKIRCIPLNKIQNSRQVVQHRSC